MADELDPDVEEVMAAELITLGALGVSLFGDFWLTQMAADMRMSKGNLHAVTKGAAISRKMRRRVRDWAVDACRRDLESALLRVRLFRAVEAAWQDPED